MRTDAIPARLSALIDALRRAYDLGLVTTALICLTLLSTLVLDLLTTTDLRLPLRLLDVACVVALLVWQAHRIARQRERDRFLAAMLQEVERARGNLDLALRAGGLGVWRSEALLEGRASILHPDLLGADVAADSNLLAMCGFPSGTPLTQRSLLQLIHRDDRERALTTIEHALHEGTHSYRDHYRIVRHDGERRTLEVRGSVTVETVPGGMRVALTGIAKDVTEEETLKANLLEKAEDARRARDAKGRFLAVMSHEVRTPMNGVLGMLDLVIDTPLEPDQRRMLRRCRESAQALLTIVNDILDFSRIEAGKLSLESTSLSLRSLIEDVCGDFALLASRKRLTLEAHVDPALPQFVLGDPVRLRQILGNLIGNAIKFTTTGAVRVRAEACEPASWMLEVQDTGAGIPAAAVARLFQPFEQADASTTRNFGGTGLGLSIVKQLAELMGGTVECWSDVGQGSRFRVVLPLRPWIPAIPSEREAEIVDAAIQLPPLARRRLLLAEDSPINQEVIIRQLAKLGHDCDCAEDGEQAWSMLRAPDTTYDALITDADMPRLDGFALTARIRAWEERHVAARLPILAMTANALPGERERCLEAGMDGYVSKPTTLPQLERALAELFAADVSVVSPSGEVDGPYADLHHLCSHDPAAVRQVLATFLSSIAKDAAALHAALVDSALGELRHLAHRMASGCLQLGEAEAQRALQSIEDAPGMPQVHEAYPRAKAALDEALARARAFLEGGDPVA